MCQFPLLGKQQEAAPVDFSRLDVRVGRIISARRHPEADSLYVEEGKCTTFVGEALRTQVLFFRSMCTCTANGA